jgi:hypothetical protein
VEDSQSGVAGDIKGGHDCYGPIIQQPVKGTIHWSTKINWEYTSPIVKYQLEIGATIITWGGSRVTSDQGGLSGEVQYTRYPREIIPKLEICG